MGLVVLVFRKYAEANSGLNTVQPIGSGSSPVQLGPVNLTNISPNSAYFYQVSGSNTSSGYNVGGSLDGENLMLFKTASGPAPEITAYSLGNIGKYSAVITAEINPNGRSTDLWLEFGGNQINPIHLPDCNNLYNMPAYTLSNLSANTTYQVKIVAQNDKGTVESGWITFSTLPEPPAPTIPPTPPIYYNYPYVTSFSLTTNVPLYKLDNVAYTWNYKNQLTGVANFTSLNNYSYDHTGSRVKASVTEINTGQTYTTHYPNKLYEKTVGPSDTTRTRYIYAGDTLVATVKKVGSGSPDITYVYTDNLGSTSATAQSDGSLGSATDYYPFGAERVCSGDCNTEKKYIGQYYDVDTALNYLNARYYDSNIGRFAGQDPVFWEIGMSKEGKQALTDPQSLNAYSYAGNNPINLIDPTGLWKEETGQAEKGDTWASVTGQINKVYGTSYTAQQVSQLNGVSAKDDAKIKVDTIIIPNAKTPDITNDLMSKMEEHSRNMGIQNPWYFKDKVKTGGDWDLKAQFGLYCSQSSCGGQKFKAYVFNGEKVRYDAPGNIHYGYVGSRTIWGFPKVLHYYAGKAQEQKGQYPRDVFGDDLTDSYYIDLGIKYSGMHR